MQDLPQAAQGCLRVCVCVCVCVFNDLWGHLLLSYLSKLLTVNPPTNTHTPPLSVDKYVFQTAS